MNFERFLDDAIDNGYNYLNEALAKLKGDVPVFIYGATRRALGVSNCLQGLGVKIEGFFVSNKKFLEDPLNVVDNALAFSDVCGSFAKFSVVIAMGEVDSAKKTLSQRAEQIENIFIFMRPNFIQTQNNGIYYLRSNIEKLKLVDSFFKEDLSKKIYRKSIKSRFLLDPYGLGEFCSRNQYFPSDIIDLCKDEIFVDGGAYIGDTLEFFRNLALSFRRYDAFEPDPKNFKKLKDFIERNSINNVRIFDKGLSDRVCNLKFVAAGTGASRLSINNEVGSTGKNVVNINLTSIDVVCPDATFIKMDIEGAELQALKGAKETMLNNKPKLAICVYHKPEDILEIPLFIKELVPEYRLFLRHHSLGDGETVLYAVR